MRRSLRLIKPGARRQLVCFHYAGGNAEYFLPWRTAVDDETAVYAVQLSGRGQRLDEKLKTCLHECADEVEHLMMKLPDRPTYFFGHSMGATLAFETALRLENAGRYLSHLFVSARIPPGMTRGTDYHRQSDESLLKKVLALGGTAAQVFENPALRALILPILRADFKAVETYQRRCQRKVSCPVTALIGLSDSEVSRMEMLQWADLTAASFDCHCFEGGHFYLNQCESIFFKYLENKMESLNND